MKKSEFIAKRRAYRSMVRTSRRELEREETMARDIEIGSEWRSTDPREPERVVRVEAADENVVHVRRVDNALSAHGRRSRIARRQFHGRFTPKEAS